MAWNESLGSTIQESSNTLNWVASSGSVGGAGAFRSYGDRVVVMPVAPWVYAMITARATTRRQRVVRLGVVPRRHDVRISRGRIGALRCAVVPNRGVDGASHPHGKQTYEGGSEGLHSGRDQWT